MRLKQLLSIIIRQIKYVYNDYSIIKIIRVSIIYKFNISKTKMKVFYSFLYNRFNQFI